MWRTASMPHVVGKTSLSDREQKGLKRITDGSPTLQSLRGPCEDLLRQLFRSQRIIRTSPEEREDPPILLRRGLREITHLEK